MLSVCSSVKCSLKPLLAFKIALFVFWCYGVLSCLYVVDATAWSDRECIISPPSLCHPLCRDGSLCRTKFINFNKVDFFWCGSRQEFCSFTFYIQVYDPYWVNFFFCLRVRSRIICMHVDTQLLRHTLKDSFFPLYRCQKSFHKRACMSGFSLLFCWPGSMGYITALYQVVGILQYFFSVFKLFGYSILVVLFLKINFRTLLVGWLGCGRNWEVQGPAGLENWSGHSYQQFHTKTCA